MKMNRSQSGGSNYTRCLVLLVLSLLSGCEYFQEQGPTPVVNIDLSEYEYIIGPGDVLNVFVWRNPEISASMPVRPDGRISAPLIDNIRASGKTPAALADEIEEILSQYIKDPFVTVTVTGFVGEYDQTIRVLGEAAQPRALPYRYNMTLLDVMIEVGGLTEFAAGNKSTLVRNENGVTSEYNIRLEDLVKDGEIEANVDVQPGDIIIIPESLF